MKVKPSTHEGHAFLECTSIEVVIANQTSYRANEICIKSATDDHGYDCEESFAIAAHADVAITKGSAIMMGENDASTNVASGESFGEEVLLGLAMDYAYTVVAERRCTLLQILADEFAERFASRPDVMYRLKCNFQKAHDKPSHRSGHVGSSSVLEGGYSGLSPAFPDVVLGHLTEVFGRMDSLHSDVKMIREHLPVSLQSLSDPKSRVVHF